MSHSTCHHLCRLMIVDGLTLSSVAFAESLPNEKAGDAYFKAMDTNGDDKLSPEEHAAGAKKMFDRMDTNKDGFLSKDELEAGHAKMLKKKVE